MSNMFKSAELVVLKDLAWLQRQQHAGNCVASALNACGDAISSCVNISLKDLEHICIEKIQNMNCSATFKGYKGFPSSICASVNKQLVHGIVSDYVLQPGDIVSIDLGATYEGAIADAARSWIYGEPKEKRHVSLLKECEKALYNAIDSIKIGSRLGVIGNAINHHAKNTGFGLITNYGGHGLDYNRPHADPFVNNKSSINEGIRIVNGLSIAIEPMFTLGGTVTKILSDGWTVVTQDLNCHFENSITIFEDKVYNITDTGRRYDC